MSYKGLQLAQLQMHSVPWCHLKFLPLQIFQAPLFPISSSFLLHSFASTDEGQRIQHKLTRSSELTSLHRCNQGMKPQGQHPLFPLQYVPDPKNQTRRRATPFQTYFIHHEIYFRQQCVSPVRVNANESSQYSNSSGCIFPKQGDINVVLCLGHFPAKMPWV